MSAQVLGLILGLCFLTVWLFYCAMVILDMRHDARQMRRWEEEERRKEQQKPRPTIDPADVYGLHV